MTEKGKAVKNRYWATIGYPESLVKNWINILQETGLKIAISPLHDADLNADESEKKPHYHIMLLWNNPTTFNSAFSLCKKIGAVIPKPIIDIRGYYEYLTHDNNPEKAQYDKKDIVTLNGFNIADYIQLTRSELIKLKIEVFNFIRMKNIIEYSVLIDELEIDGSIEMLDCATSNTILFNNYLASKRNMIQEKRS